MLYATNIIYNIDEIDQVHSYQGFANRTCIVFLSISMDIRFYGYQIEQTLKMNSEWALLFKGVLIMSKISSTSFHWAFYGKYDIHTY